LEKVEGKKGKRKPCQPESWNGSVCVDMHALQEEKGKAPGFAGKEKNDFSLFLTSPFCPHLIFYPAQRKGEEKKKGSPPGITTQRPREGGERKKKRRNVSTLQVGRD